MHVKQISSSNTLKSCLIIEEHEVLPQSVIVFAQYGERNARMTTIQINSYEILFILLFCTLFQVHQIVHKEILEQILNRILIKTNIDVTHFLGK